MKNYKANKGFTLAETLIVIAVLGIVAMLTVPNVIRQHMEAVARTKIKKSMTVYDLAITKMTVENDLRSDKELENWADNAEKNDCANTSAYFKAKSCKFKTADGVWWYIDKIMNPIIALSEKDLDDAIDSGINGKTSFKLVASFDRQSGAFRVDDLGYEKLMLALVSGNNKNETEDNIEELEMLFDFINNKKDDSAGNTVKLLSMQCTTSSDEDSYYSYCIKYDYDSNWNNTVEYRCDGSGKNCFDSIKYEYDKNGNKTASYYECDGSGNNCAYSTKWEYDDNGKVSYTCDGSGKNCFDSVRYEYDSNGNQTAYYYNCDGNGNNCHNSQKYEYDGNGNQTALYYNCDGSGNNCSSSTKYEYDGNGNKTASYSCNGSGNNCSSLTKYEYDGNGNKTAQYSYCDGSGKNCFDSTKYEYDGNGNKTASYSCNGSGNNCSSSTKYEYDGNGNKTASYYCNGSGNDCTRSYKYEYDGNGNITVEYYCNGNGDNCNISATYENTYIDR